MRYSVSTKVPFFPEGFDFILFSFITWMCVVMYTTLCLDSLLHVSARDHLICCLLQPSLYLPLRVITCDLPRTRVTTRENNKHEQYPYDKNTNKNKNMNIRHSNSFSELSPMTYLEQDSKHNTITRNMNNISSTLFQCCDQSFLPRAKSTTKNVS
jgi:hypothetical protein